MAVFISLLMTLRDCARSRAILQLEILALRHQLHVLERSHGRRLRLTRFDRLLWVWFSRAWCQWRTVLVHRQTRNGHRVASARVPPVLDVEEPPQDWSADGPSRGPHADSNDVGRQSALGCASDSR